MNLLTKHLCRYFFPRIASRACESRIPRSGEEGEKVNCFSTSIDKHGEPYLHLSEFTNDKLKCLEWDGSRYSIDKVVSLKDVNLSDIYITHYYGLSEVKYFGVLDFAIGQITRWPYIKIYFLVSISNLDQYFFNKKKLITKQSVDLLKFLVSRSLDGKEGFEEFELMTDLYSIKWVLHPDRESQNIKLNFYLDSLVDTGELRKINNKFFVTGNALRALEQYEEQERKHTENVKMQRRMYWLTLAIAFLTAVQAGLIKLPTIVDLSKYELAPIASLTMDSDRSDNKSEQFEKIK